MKTGGYILLQLNFKIYVSIKFSWYSGCLGRQKAEERLRKAGEVGSYLVRESESNKGSYVLSYLGLNGMTHFK